MRLPGSHACLLAAGALALAFTLAAPASPTVSAQAPSAPLSFNRDIRPILSNNCFTCHGPDEKQRETKFHFDTREGAFLEEGIIVPGNSGRSALYRRITHEDANERMPPFESGHTLTDKQIDLLKRWIDEGAKWDTHWAYAAPVRPEPPPVAKKNWPRNPIDRFILARLEREGLEPSREADKAALLRRVTYDLTGLPPTPAELDAFLADRSPDAYEKRVDALLQSPHYGERMAVPWLDAARYGDTHGYHIDSHRGMWPWRDWVIGAFNRNLPFDQFAIEQLAGDLLPAATRDQQVASGFNRNHMINFEGGAIAAEYQVEYVMDRVDATATTFMGLTMACARCHSHKFDPISHKEFYQFYAFFNNVPELGLDGRRGNAAPTLLLTTAPQEQMLEELEARIEGLNIALGDDYVRPSQQAWEQSVADRVRGNGDGVDRAGLAAHYELDGSFSDISGRYQHGRMVSGDPTFEAGQIGRGVSFDGDTEVSFGNVGAFDRAEPFSIAVWLRGRGNLPTAVFQKLDDKDHRRGFEWRLDDMELFDIQRWAGRLTVTLTSEAPANAIQVKTRERLRQGDWTHVVMAYDGSGRAGGLATLRQRQTARGRGRQGCAQGTDSNRRRAHPRPTGARAAVRRADRRPASLPARVDAGRGRRPGAALPRARDPVGTDWQAIEGADRLPQGLLPDVCRAGRAQGETARADGGGQGEGHDREDDSDGDGDGRAEEAARVVRAGPGRLSQPDRQGAAGRARDSAGAGRRRAAQPADAREVAGAAGSSAHRPRRRQSFLADVFRHRHRQDPGRFRRPGRAAGRTRSCSTGLRPSSCAAAGTCARCSA